MTSKELTYQDIVKLRKQMQENNRNFYEQPIVITYQQAIQIENECLALEQENEKLKKENKSIRFNNLQVCNRNKKYIKCIEEILEYAKCELDSIEVVDKIERILKEVLGE